jgi:hypothetical protein
MDTTAEAAAIQMRIHQRLTGAERLIIAIRMSDAARELALSRLRLEHPDLDESALLRVYLRLQFGVPV